MVKKLYDYVKITCFQSNHYTIILMYTGEYIIMKFNSIGIYTRGSYIDVWENEKSKIISSSCFMSTTHITYLYYTYLSFRAS